MKFKKILACVAGIFLLYIVACFAYASYYKPKKMPKLALLAEAQLPTKPLLPQKVQQLNDILCQPFYFLGQGKQCVAYASRDGKYVLKFLLQKPLKPKRRAQQLPNFFPFTFMKQQEIAAKTDRKNKLAEAFRISYEVIPEETGTLFVHLNATRELFIRPLIIDSELCPVSIDVNNVQFVVQKRACLIKPLIIELMFDGKIDEAKNRLDQILQLLYDSAKKQVVDVDQALIRNNNIGFLDAQAIYIDTGKLRLLSHPLAKRDFVTDLKRLKPFQRWLEANYPELAGYFDAKIQHTIDHYDHESSR